MFKLYYICMYIYIYIHIMIHCSGTFSSWDSIFDMVNATNVYTRIFSRFSVSFNRLIESGHNGPAALKTDVKTSPRAHNCLFYTSVATTYMRCGAVWVDGKKAGFRAISGSSLCGGDNTVGVKSVDNAMWSWGRRSISHMIYLMPHDGTRCHAMLRDATGCHVIPQDATPCHAMLHDATLCHMVQRDTTWCHVMPHDTTPCHTIWHIMPHDAIGPHDAATHILTRVCGRSQ